jgi:hypothetical protein
MRADISKLRGQRQYLEALRAFRADCPVGDVALREQEFRQHFLGGRDESNSDLPCLLLQAAAQNGQHSIEATLKVLDEPGSETLVRSLASYFPEGPHSELFQARILIFCAIASDAHSRSDLILKAARLTEAAIPSVPRAKQSLPNHAGIPPAFFEQLSNPWKKILVAAKTRLSTGLDLDWDRPSLLMIGETLAYLLNRGELLPAVSSAETWVLLNTSRVYDRPEYSYEYPDGAVARLVVEKIGEGSGRLYPDCRFTGYLPTDESFQQGLRNVMTVLRSQTDWAERGGDFYDYCWRLIPLGPRINGDPARIPLMMSVAGQSAEAAFACAIWATLRKERLDPHVVVSAWFLDPDKDGRPHLRAVDGIVEKLSALQRGEPSPLGAAMKYQAIDRLVVSSDQPAPAIAVDPSIQLCKAKDLDDAYRQLSSHEIMTDRYRHAVRWMTERWFAKECAVGNTLGSPTGDYIPCDLHRQNDLPNATKTTIPLDPQCQQDFYNGRVREALSFADSRNRHANIVADSGIGKTSLLHYLAHQSTTENATAIPILVADLNEFLKTSTPHEFIRATVARIYALLKEYEQNQPSADGVVSNNDLKEDDVVEWFKTAVERSEVVWLLDALDQVSANRKQLSNLLIACPTCSVVMTMRREALPDSVLNGPNLYLQPFSENAARTYLGHFADLFFGRLPIGDPEILKIPLLLHLLKGLVVERKIDPESEEQLEFRNRYSVYQAVLNGHGGLVEKGCATLKDRGDLDGSQRNLATLRRQSISHLAGIAGMQWKSRHFDTFVTGKLYEQLADDLDRRFSSDAEDALLQINIFTRLPTFDRDVPSGFKWRHRSFLEFYAGLWLTRSADEAEQFFRDHCRDPDYSWVFRFAVSAVADDPVRLGQFALWLLQFGAPFLLWTIIDEDHIVVEPELETLCRWLVHRDRESWKDRFDQATSPWADQPEETGPDLTASTLEILKSLFALDWTERDSRWLSPAWQLVERGLRDPDFQTTCKSIQDSFLSEFERRVELAAEKCRGKPLNKWSAEDRGLLELLPDEELVTFGLLPETTLQQIRRWPSPVERGDSLTYEQRRDRFNDQLKTNQAHYCQCPPVDWEHPYRDDNGAVRDPRTCLIGEDGDRRIFQLPEVCQMQRTPLTNLQFEAFDRLHRRERQLDWKRAFETEQEALDHHPVIDVSWYQARMFCVWLTGRGKFGTFRLPTEDEWEACCRAGRDKPGEEFGIPLCNQELDSILDQEGNERFDAMSSHGANFNGNRPENAEIGPNRNGTIPVGQFHGNGFGLVDMHGQVWEWTRSAWDFREPAELTGNYRHYVCARGSSYCFDAWACRCSDRSRNAPDFRFNFLGFRLLRTSS